MSFQGLESNQLKFDDFIDDLLTVIYRVLEVPEDKKVQLREAVVKLFRLRGKKLFKTMLRIYRYGE
jgi:hypothetical protein